MSLCLPFSGYFCLLAWFSVVSFLSVCLSLWLCFLFYLLDYFTTSLYGYLYPSFSFYLSRALSYVSVSLLYSLPSLGPQCPACTWALSSFGRLHSTAFAGTLFPIATFNWWWVRTITHPQAAVLSYSVLTCSGEAAPEELTSMYFPWSPRAVLPHNDAEFIYQVLSAIIRENLHQGSCASHQKLDTMSSTFPFYRWGNRIQRGGPSWPRSHSEVVSAVWLREVTVS